MNSLPVLMLITVVLILSGCAALQEALVELPTTDATAEIGALQIIAGDYLKEPYGSGILLGLGYALALLRRWYKKQKGAKSV